MIIIVLAVAWLVGLWLASLTAWPLPAWWITAALAALATLATFLGRHRQAGLIFAGLAVLALGGARYTLAVPHIDENHIAYYNDSAADATILGVVSRKPDVRDRYVNLRLAAEQLTLADGTTRALTGDVLVQASLFPAVPYGARLAVTGRLLTPPEFDTFSYKDYLARQNIHSLVRAPRLTILAEGAGHPLYHAIFAFKDHAQATINRQLPEPQAALLSGILLGNANGLPPDLVEAFRVTGMTHIIAISGFNIALLIGLFIGVSRRLLPHRPAAVLALIGVAGYTLLVGADASVVRAAIMGSLFLMTSRWLGRPNYGLASLLLAAVLMTLFNPMALWDVGFQLSFSATLGLLLYADPFSQWLRRQLQRLLEPNLIEKVMRLLSDAVLVTLAAQVLTLPLMMAYFRHFSLISLPANFLILPAQPGVMIWGGLATLVGLMAPAVGQVLAWIAWLFLSYTIGLVRLFAAVPGAAVPVVVSPAAVILIYSLIAAVTWLSRQEPERQAQLVAQIALLARRQVSQKLALGGSLAVLVLTVSWARTQPDGYLHVTFFDVGQGDAIFIQTPSGRQILVDGGLYPSQLNDQLGRQMPFWDREIDVLVATHPDADHVTGLAGVFDRYRVGRLITDGEGHGESPIYDAVLLAAEGAGTPIHPARAGEIILIEDGVRLETLHPGDHLDRQNRNENSVSLRLVYGDFTLLLTGDAEEQAERAMLARRLPLASLIFKAGHHGSRTSSGESFLGAVQPRVVVVSAGRDNRFGHPHPEVLQRVYDVGAVVLRTDELGMIEVITDGRAMWWQAHP